MISIDYTTVALVLAMIYVIVAMVFFVLLRIIKWEQGIKIWLIGSNISIVGFVALFLRPTFGSYAQMVGTFSLLTSTYLILEGVLRFRNIGDKQKRQRLNALIIIGFFVIAFFTTNNATIRYSILDALILIMCPVIVYCILKGTKGTERILSYLFAGAFVFEGIWFTIRFILALSGAFGSEATTSHPFMGTIYLVSIIWLLMYVFSILLIISYRAQARIQAASERDELTGLYNRRKLDANLSFLIDRNRSYKEKFAVYLLDVNGFKKVNDTFGHVFGDMLLVELAKRIERMTRAEDFSCRFGGDEFIIILRITGEKDEAVKARERIKRIIEEPFESGNYTVSIKTAIGFTFVEDSAITLDEILKNADKNMYFEKESNYESTKVIKHNEQPQ